MDICAIWVEGIAHTRQDNGLPEPNRSVGLGLDIPVDNPHDPTKTVLVEGESRKKEFSWRTYIAAPEQCLPHCD